MNFDYKDGIDFGFCNSISIPFPCGIPGNDFC